MRESAPACGPGRGCLCTTRSQQGLTTPQTSSNCRKHNNNRIDAAQQGSHGAAVLIMLCMRSTGCGKAWATRGWHGQRGATKGVAYAARCPSYHVHRSLSVALAFGFGGGEQGDPGDLQPCVALPRGSDIGSQAPIFSIQQSLDTGVKGTRRPVYVRLYMHICTE